MHLLKLGSEARKGLAEREQQAALAHWEVREKGPGGQVQGVSLGEATTTCFCPDCKSWVPYSLEDVCLLGEKREKKRGKGIAQGVP